MNLAVWVDLKGGEGGSWWASVAARGGDKIQMINSDWPSKSRGVEWFKSCYLGQNNYAKLWYIWALRKF